MLEMERTAFAKHRAETWGLQMNETIFTLKMITVGPRKELCQLLELLLHNLPLILVKKIFLWLQYI